MILSPLALTAGLPVKIFFPELKGRRVLCLCSDDAADQGLLQRAGDHHQQQEEHRERDVWLHHRPHRAPGPHRQVRI